MELLLGLLEKDEDRDRDEDSSSFTSFMLILIHTIQSLLESENKMYPFAIVNCLKTKEKPITCLYSKKL